MGFAESYAESLHNTSGHIIAVADRDSIIAVSGGSKKELLEKSLSEDIVRVMENRDMFVASSADSQRIPVITEEKAAPSILAGHFSNYIRGRCHRSSSYAFNRPEHKNGGC